MKRRDGNALSRRVEVTAIVFAMLDACRNGDIETLRTFLARGADPNQALDDGGGREGAANRATRPLHAAIEITRRHGRGPRRVETARLLLEAGADPHSRGTRFGVTPLVLAALAGAPEFIGLLMGDDGPRDIVTAAAIADLTAVERFVRERPERARELDETGWTPLAAASASRLHHEDLVLGAALPRITSLLLAHGADPNVGPGIGATGETWTALTWASGHADNLPVVRVLVEGGAVIGDPVLIFEALVNEHYEVLEFLVSRGLELDRRSNRAASGSPIPAPGETVLHRILAEPTSRGVEWLLDHGADANVPGGEHGDSALHVAARAGCGVRVFQSLIGHGAEINARNAAGETPLAIALGAGRRRLVALLRDAGGTA